MRTWFLHVIEYEGCFYVEGMEVEFIAGCDAGCSDFDQFGPKFDSREKAALHMEIVLKANRRTSRWNFTAQEVYDGSVV